MVNMCIALSLPPKNYSALDKCELSGVAAEVKVLVVVVFLCIFDEPVLFQEYPELFLKSLNWWEFPLWLSGISGGSLVLGRKFDPWSGTDVYPGTVG